MADTQTIDPHLSGVLAPVRSEDDFELKVVGRIPDALAGAYYRNGPNPQFDPQGKYLSIFGDGMIHGFFLEPNKDGGRAMGAAPAIATAGFARRDGRRRTRQDASCSATWATRAILPSPTSIGAPRTSTSSTMPAS